MSFDGQCSSPPDGLEVPTLKINEAANPCDRTDYSAVEEMSHKTGTSAKMYEEAQSYFDELVEVNTKFKLGQPNSELREQSELEAQLAYDLHQFQIASPGTFRIEYRPDNKTETNKIGSGFAVAVNGEDCQIVTDYHVVTKEDGSLEPNLSVRAQNGKSGSVTIDKLHSSTDLALLSVPISAIGSCPTLPLAQRTDGLKPRYDRITAVGHPGGSNAQFLSGGELLRIDRKHKEINNHPDGKVKPWKENVVAEVAAHVVGGNSGGPAMANGEVVGATQYKRATYEMFFTPAEDIQAILADFRDDDGPVDCASAKQEIRNRRANGEASSASFSGHQNQIRSEYQFKDGTTYIMEEFKNSCRRITNPLTG